MLDRLNSILSKKSSDGHAPTCVIIEGREIPIQWKRSKRARSISLRADTVKGIIKISLPHNAATESAMKFLDRKKEWLATRFETAPKPVPIIDGAKIAYEGESHIIIWDEKLGRKIIQEFGVITLGGPKDHIQNRIIRWMKQQAHIIFMDDIAHYCAIAKAETPKLAIGDARGRWGSCSTRGTIRLNWRLIMAPVSVRCSVIAHEVAHIKHMNHSSAFYDWLDTIYEGDRLEADAWLKRHGIGLYMIGEKQNIDI